MNKEVIADISLKHPVSVRKVNSSVQNVLQRGSWSVIKEGMRGGRGRQRGRQGGTRRYQWVGLNTLHYILRKRVQTDPFSPIRPAGGQHRGETTTCETHHSKPAGGLCVDRHVSLKHKWAWFTNTHTHTGHKRPRVPKGLISSFMADRRRAVMTVAAHSPVPRSLHLTETSTDVL